MVYVEDSMKEREDREFQIVKLSEDIWQAKGIFAWSE